MRSFIAALFMAGAVTAQTASEYYDCATAALEGIDMSKFNDCTDLNNTECLCANKDAISELTQSAKDACNKAGIDVDDLASSLCGATSDKVAAPARHASRPMEPAEELHMRAYSPSEDASQPRVITVTVTESCACKTTPTDAMHISQIPVFVPASSSMGSMAAASSPSYSNGIRVGGSSSSAIYGSQMSATPTPSGASANRFHTFQGAAPQVNAARGGVAALGVAAVMGLMIAL